MPKLKNKRKVKNLKFQKHSRKKHVETMFITNKQKKYPFYFKPSNVTALHENSRLRYYPKRKFFHIVCLRAGYITINPLKALMRLFKYSVKSLGVEKNFRYKIHIFPDFVLTSKPKEVRMGKGKGANLRKVVIVKRGQIIFSLKSSRFCWNLAKAVTRGLAHKIPLKSKVIWNHW